MREKKRVQDWLRMYKEFNDPDIRAVNKRKEERRRRLEEKVSDTGL